MSEVRGILVKFHSGGEREFMFFPVNTGGDSESRKDCPMAVPFGSQVDAEPSEDNFTEYSIHVMEYEGGVTDLLPPYKPSQTAQKSDHVLLPWGPLEHPESPDYRRRRGKAGFAR